jgi:adenylyl cyclase-associated protein
MMKKNEKEIELFKIFKNLLKTVVDFVETYNKNGLNWQIKGNNEINDLILELGATYRNNFSPKDNNDEKELELKKMNENKNKIRIAIESGEIKSHLKPIAKKSENQISEIKEEEDNANENNQKEKIKFSCSTFFNTGTRKSYASKNDKENYEENKNIIMYENYFQLNKIIEPEKLQIGTFIKIVNCINCTFNINKRINKIMVVNCENCNISCNELISDIEIINCSKINVICEGHIDIAIVYRSKGIIFLLNSVSKSLKVRRSFSEDIVLEVIKENEGYKEYVDYRLPEQSVFRINEEKKMEIKYINY